MMAASRPPHSPPVPPRLPPPPPPPPASPPIPTCRTEAPSPPLPTHRRSDSPPIPTLRGQGGATSALDDLGPDDVPPEPLASNPPQRRGTYVRRPAAAQQQARDDVESDRETSGAADRQRESRAAGAVPSSHSPRNKTATLKTSHRNDVIELVVSPADQVRLHEHLAGLKECLHKREQLLGAHLHQNEMLLEQRGEVFTVNELARRHVLRSLSAAAR
eukprot:m.351654 g.351654  ORF g.351654 m.351654 type:complete len:217 (+) comp19898_c0_seq1:2223-2873(+)